MSVDHKTAKHTCNVIRRQIQGAYPDLFMHFIVHGEDQREQEYKKEEKLILEHPAGKYMVNYLNSVESHNVIAKNKSRFCAMARNNSPGFLGFFKSQSFLALCFLNYERFDNDNNLKNHALHLTWHAISLYLDFLNNRREETSSFSLRNHILTESLAKQKLYHQNLKADIFAASVQTLQGKECALETLATQRMHDTLTPETGFQAEKFPFPMCLETLDFLFESNTCQFKKTKKPVIDSVTITNNIGKTYESESIEQWVNFSISAQTLAWQSHAPETILGAAIYTAENTYDQSIADMIAERLNIKPDYITNFNSYNPFTESEANTRLHKKICTKTIQSIIDKTEEQKTNLFYEIIQKQNTYLQQGSAIGWCAYPLLQAVRSIENSTGQKSWDDIITKAKIAFENALETINWETLQSLSTRIFEHKRSEGKITQEQFEQLCASHEEYTPIHDTITAEKEFQKRAAENKEAEKNITDFISDNYAKKTEIKTTF